MTKRSTCRIVSKLLITYPKMYSFGNCHTKTITFTHQQSKNSLQCKRSRKKIKRCYLLIYIHRTLTHVQNLMKKKQIGYCVFFFVIIWFPSTSETPLLMHLLITYVQTLTQFIPSTLPSQWQFYRVDFMLNNHLIASYYSFDFYDISVKFVQFVYSHSLTSLSLLIPLSKKELSVLINP